MNTNKICHFALWTVAAVVLQPFLPIAGNAAPSISAIPHSIFKPLVAEGLTLRPTKHNLAPGGANQVKGTNGKIGDWFFTGKWRFCAVKVVRTQSYKDVYWASPGTWSPTSPNDDLLAIYCTIKNGMNTSSEPALVTQGMASQVTAVGDDQGESFAPYHIDSRNGALVPGAAKKFVILFSVPKDAKLTDLIFSIYAFGDTKPVNVRVSLAGY